MRRQAPSSLARSALPVQRSSRSPTCRSLSKRLLHRTPSTGAALAAVATATGCFWLSDSQPASLSVKPEFRLAAVGEAVQVSLGSGAASCRTAWSINGAPAAAARDATLEASGASASFTARAPGDYVLAASCGKAAGQTTISIFQPTATLSLGSPLTLPIHCYDAVAGPRGRILCVYKGVNVVDPETGRVVGKTAEPVPLLWGLDAQGELFATTSLGCKKPDPLCPTADVDAGALIYRLPGDDQPVLLGVIKDAPTGVPTIDGSQLYVSTSGRVARYDIADPTRSQSVACLASRDLGEIPVPFRFRDQLGVLSFKNLLAVHDAGKLPATCDTETPPRGRVVLDESRQKTQFYARPTVQGSMVYAGSTDAFYAIDVSEPTRPLVTARIGTAAGATVVYKGRLIALLDTGVVAMDLADPQHPRPVALHHFGAGATALFERLLVIGDRLWMTRDSSLTAIELKEGR